MNTETFIKELENNGVKCIKTKIPFDHCSNHARIAKNSCLKENEKSRWKLYFIKNFRPENSIYIHDENKISEIWNSYIKMDEFFHVNVHHPDFFRELSKTTIIHQYKTIYYDDLADNIIRYYGDNK